MMLTRGTRGWRRKEARKGGNGSPSFITCRSECFSTTAVETATAVCLSRPEKPPTQIELGGDLDAEGDFSASVDEKGL